ncbi:hypothetical protein NPIL_457461 [Nephila pilipes]|uniref:Uncharacterized protein n=1 Tax=Nephila pilipes TaxID=299642 RepID=A0A8X6QHP9_NEPPI|nr:hypothetical protein NPIL_687481 [Nephila pilipes]GFU22634.1 hypothetical protein NPIL_457461 [Nephila pilipes]
MVTVPRSNYAQGLNAKQFSVIPLILLQETGDSTEQAERSGKHGNLLLRHCATKGGAQHNRESQESGEGLRRTCQRS